MLFDIFKEKTNHLEGHCKNLFQLPYLPQKRKKLTAQSIIDVLNNFLDTKSSCNERLNRFFNSIAIDLTYFLIST